MAAPARGCYWKESLGVMRMWETSGSALSGVTMEDIFERTRAFAMDELHYDTMAASCLDFNAKMITTALEAAGRECVSKLDEHRCLYTITETDPEFDSSSSSSIPMSTMGHLETQLSPSVAGALPHRHDG